MDDDLDAFERSIIVAAEAASAELILEITTELIAATPVDTHLAQANWIPTLDGPLSEAIDDVSAAQSAQDEGIAKLVVASLFDAFRVPTGAMPTVSNAVPYMGRLNDGSSDQASAGFVEAAVASAEATVDARVAARETKL